MAGDAALEPVEQGMDRRRRIGPLDRGTPFGQDTPLGRGTPLRAGHRERDGSLGRDRQRRRPGSGHRRRRRHWPGLVSRFGLELGRAGEAGLGCALGRGCGFRRAVPCRHDDGTDRRRQLEGLEPLAWIEDLPARCRRRRCGSRQPVDRLLRNRIGIIGRERHVEVGGNLAFDIRFGRGSAARARHACREPAPTATLPADVGG